MPRRLLYRFLLLLALAGWAVVVLGFCIAPYSIPSGTMEPTIHTGDRILVLKQLLIGKVRRGDLIAFRFPGDPSQMYLKRVVGIPGDRLRLDNKQLYLNGYRAVEPYAEYRTDYTDPYRDSFPSAPNGLIYDGARRMLQKDTRGGEVVVPPGNYFVLGDNRDASLDSRYFGFVPAANIVGRPVYIYGSAAGRRGAVPRIALP